MTNAKLVLSNGMTFEGSHIGANVPSVGEMVFTTSMVGYSESITDPSFCGQILVFSYPMIGNYGLPVKKDESNYYHLTPGYESHRSWLSGVVVSSDCLSAENETYKTNLNDWLKSEGISGITGIDTRELVKIIRSSETITGKIVTGFNLSEKNDGLFSLETNLVSIVSTKMRQVLGTGKTKVAIVDFGVKWGIIKKLLDLDCQVEIVPWNDDLSKVHCDGFILSNGPGDPNTVSEIFPEIRKMVETNRNVLGICLGHQILAIAMGGATKRLPFGHRGYNHPVIECKTMRGFMTSQNHSYYVDDKSLDKSIWEVTFINANDQTIEGISHKIKPVSGIQFHPEASGGPNDCVWILNEFVNSLR